MALTKITPQMFDTSAAGHDFNIDNGTFVVDASANRVGIGTATPSTLLHVDGTATATTFVGALTGNVTGNVTGNLTGTILTAAQTNITSLGTLTALTVDDITIDGSTISDAGGFLIDVGGDITLDADGADINFSDGGTLFGQISNASGLYLVSNVSNAPMYLRGNDGGNYVNAITIDFANGGNVGIGTTTPSTSLDIVRAGVQPLRLQSTSGTEVQLNMVNTGGNVQLEAHSGNFTIDADKVGIGTSTPQSYNALADDLVIGATTGSTGITIVGATNGHSSIYLADGATGASQQYAGYMQYAHGSDALIFGTSATERLRILSDGKIGIGTTGPSANLSLGAAVGAKRFLVYDGANVNNLYAGFGIDSPAANDFSMYAHNNGVLRFGKMSTDGSTITAHMTINNIGDVSIGADGVSSGGGNRLAIDTAVNAAPVTSGTTQTGGALRLRGGDNAVLDFGLNSVNTWIQATDKVNLANGYNISLNPNGGFVGIGTFTNTSGGALATPLTIAASSVGNGIELFRGANSKFEIYMSNNGIAYFNVDGNPHDSYRWRYAGTDFMRTERSVLYLMPSGQSGTYTLNAGTGASGTGSNQTRIQVDGAIDMGYQGRFTSCIWGPTVLASNGRYTHLRTSMWGGGSPHGNTEYIMGGFLITGYRYQSNANHRMLHQFHNWNDILYNYSANNLIDGGGWSGGSGGASHVYIDSTGFVTIRLDSESSNYRMFMVDYVNYSIYSKVDSAITAITVSNNTTV